MSLHEMTVAFLHEHYKRSVSILYQKMQTLSVTVPIYTGLSINHKSITLCHMIPWDTIYSHIMVYLVDMQKELDALSTIHTIILSFKYELTL